MRFSQNIVYMMGFLLYPYGHYISQLCLHLFMFGVDVGMMVTSFANREFANHRGFLAGRCSTSAVLPPQGLGYFDLQGLGFR